MLSPAYYESCTDAILKLYEQLEDAIISDIIRRILKTGMLTATAQHQIEQLQEMGLLYQDILALIAQQTDATTQHVKALFEDAGVESVQIDNEVYRENDLTPVDIRQSPAMKQTLEAGYRKTLGNMKNLTLTTAITAQTAYFNACNQAYMQVSSGAFSYQEAIRQAIKKTAENGATVLYPSGHRDRIDVAVRRSVLTGIGQTCREIGKMNAEESGCDLMEITAHSGARPDHAKWQGQLVSLSGKNAGRTISGKKVLSLRQVGYGTGDGIFGWNCRHDWFPFFEGYSRPVYSKSDLKKLDEKNITYNGENYSEYEISQIQRRYEREIRAAKREQVAFQTAFDETDDPDLKQVMQESLNFSKSLVKNKQAKMRDFIQQTGQKRDYFREQNYGFDKKKTQEVIPEYIQYRRIEYDTLHPVTVQRAEEISLCQVTNSVNKIYVSDGARKSLKPKKLHKIDTHLSEVCRMMGISKNENLPRVYILDGIEMATNAVAAYNAILDVLYVNKEISIYEEDNIPPNMNQFACYKDDRSSYIHELYHWIDAEKFRRRYGNVTTENYSNYVNFINKEAKKRLDKIQKKGYNITEISDYARNEYDKQKYYETYTEYRVTDLLKE
ncbi:MAG: phage minor capsid protein [Oscillospiraceae bacterium]|nr:phage minor capsid protein [Oscillospiraceae bacterium]